MPEKRHVAIDLGASNGRVLQGLWNGSQFRLEELHRFSNHPQMILGGLFWNILSLLEGIETGLRRCSATRGGSVDSVAVDTWGVDYALVDKDGQPLGLPYHYRDRRTEGIPGRVFARVPAHEVYRRTGNQLMPINTLYQLYSMVEKKDPRLKCADHLLMMPDLFNCWLTGEIAAEYTIASTTQMMNISTGTWDFDLLEKLDIPVTLLPEIVSPGACLGNLHSAVARNTGLGEAAKVITVGSHDTASAVAAVPHLDDQSIFISSGTWNLVGVELAEPLVNDRVEAANFTNEGGVGGRTRFLKNMTGFWLLQESARAWNLRGTAEEWEDLMAEAERAPSLRSLVDPDDPVFMQPPDMIHAIQNYCRRTGQKVPDRRGEIVRCCLESMALKTRHLIGELEAVTGEKRSIIRIVGGGSLNSLFCSLLADACRYPVVAGPAEATALGNILVQAVAAGEIGSLSDGRQIIADSVPLIYFDPSPHLEQWEEASELLDKLVQVCRSGATIGNHERFNQ